MSFLRDVRTERFWRRFGLAFFASVGAIATLVGLYDALFTGGIPKDAPWLVPVILVVSAMFAGVRAWPRPIEVTYRTPNTTVRLIEGDIFNQKGHLVIGATDTFDTAAPHIANTSLQAQFLDRVYGGDVAALDQDLDEALRRRDPIGQIDKPGKTVRYGIGTVATLSKMANKYFWVAYTEMNERNEARASVPGLWASLDALWTEVRARANGGTLCITVVGGGQSRLSQILPAQDAIRFTVMSFMLASRHEKVCDELIIVARPSEFKELDKLEIQAFLSSLKAS